MGSRVQGAGEVSSQGKWQEDRGNVSECHGNVQQEQEWKEERLDDDTGKGCDSLEEAGTAAEQQGKKRTRDAGGKKDGIGNHTV